MSILDHSLLALADPTRRAILARLSRGEATVMDLAAPFALTQPAISHHLKVLERAGLIERRREGTRRPCRLRPEGLAPLDAYLAGLRDAMEDNYARLDALLAEDNHPKTGDPA
jgi:DNA-binding transcriptional ArsR family regulator